MYLTYFKQYRTYSFKKQRNFGSFWISKSEFLNSVTQTKPKYYKEDKLNYNGRRFLSKKCFCVLTIYSADTRTMNTNTFFPAFYLSSNHSPGS